MTETDAKVIKRYPNRKLYDTDAKRYVRLNDIAKMIQAGHEIQVVDHTTQEDLTAVTLTQIIFEQEKKEGGVFANGRFARTRPIRRRNTQFTTPKPDVPT